MVTRTGGLVAACAVALVFAGRLLGLLELYLLGASAGILLVLCMLLVSRTHLQLELSRQVHPARVHADADSRVEVLVANRGERRTPLLRLKDQVSGTRGAEVLLGPIGPEMEAVAAYRLPTRNRGRLTVGPLSVVVTDPFGLAAVSTAAAGPTHVTVYPRVEVIAPLSRTTGDDPRTGLDRASALGQSGGEFYAVRPYFVGDELRRVHWPSTARHDELMVRQHELPRQGRATVLLDTRAATHTAESFELAVSGAASVVVACWRNGDQVRLVTTTGSDSGFARGGAQLLAILEHLAIVEPSHARPGQLVRTIDRLARSADGAVAAIATDAAAPDLALLSRLRRSFGLAVIALFERSADQPARNEGPSVDPGVVRVTADNPFAGAWNRAMAAATEASRLPRLATPVVVAEL